MNDIFEHTKQVFFDTHSLFDIEEKDVLCELKRYCQVSFSNDHHDKRAFMLWQMWGHYADSGKGICLVFEKSKLADLCRGQFYFGDVFYTEEECGNIVLNESPKPFFENNISEIFFTKNREWEHEREFRIISSFDDDTNHYLSFGDSLLCAIAISEQPASVNDALAKHNKPLLFLSQFLGDWQLTHDQSELIWYSVNPTDYKLNI